MQMSNHNEHSLMANYSPSALYSLGVRSDLIRDDESWMHTATYNRLLKRWNKPDSQANIFLLTGLGVAARADDQNAAGTIGIEADWENRRLYAAYENRFVHAGNIEKSFSQFARAAFAPYKGDYNDLHTWVGLQIDHHPGEKETVAVTPFVRLFTTDVLGEIGVSDKRDVMLNLTYQF